ncbi:MAG TPA: SDR family oxidoreductase [Acidisarcina sp.]
MMVPFKGSYALVTGASKGLGSAYARALAERGANLVLVARSLEAMQDLAQELRLKHRVRIETIQADLTDLSATDQIAKHLSELQIRVDLLINNAGAGLSGHFLGHTIENEISQIDLNVRGLVALTYRFGREMADRRMGGIINISSNSAFQPVPYMATYGATKAFTLMFTEAIAEELRSRGVRVMVACPGPTATQFFDQAPTTMKVSEMDTAEFVAQKTLRDFERGKVVSYPGRTSVRVLSWSARLIPRSTAVKIAALFSKKMGLADR